MRVLRVLTQHYIWWQPTSGGGGGQGRPDLFTESHGLPAAAAYSVAGFVYYNIIIIIIIVYIRSKLHAERVYNIYIYVILSPREYYNITYVRPCNKCNNNNIIMQRGGELALVPIPRRDDACSGVRARLLHLLLLLIVISSTSSPSPCAAPQLLSITSSVP